MATIFFVDDDLASNLVIDNLTQRGHDVERYSSLDAALDAVERISRGDLVVLDLIMPEGQTQREFLDGPRAAGMAIYRELRKLRSDLPIIVYTANQDPALVDVISDDSFATYVSRWSSPSLKEFIDIVHSSLGIKPTQRAIRPFIVHGHDEKVKWEVKNYLQNTLGLVEPIILHEQPNLGRTVIEKFEDSVATTDLVFVLLTPDDKSASVTDSNDNKRRARQNVIFELGFFLGCFGRRSGRIILLYKGALEIPSDLSGVVYLNIDAGIESVSDQIRREIANVYGQRVRRG